MSDTHFKYHIFFCTNQRPNGENCCANYNANTLRDYTKQRCKALGLNGVGKVRISNAGCLDRCEFGPVMVVYPEAIWYSYVDEADLDEIIESHLQNGQPVKRLMVDQAP